jgi:hypothetical protein
MEHRNNVGVSRMTVTGTASGGGRESWKEAAFFDTAMNRRVHSIPAGWYVQEVLEVASVAVGQTVRSGLTDSGSSTITQVGLHFCSSYESIGVIIARLDPEL